MKVKIVEKTKHIMIQKNNYAIVQISGKQCLFQPVQWYDLDVLKGKINETLLGNFVFLNKILLFKKMDKIQLGKPFLQKSQLPIKIIQHVKGLKITVLKTKPKKKYTRTRGHRQKYTRIHIDL